MKRCLRTIRVIRLRLAAVGTATMFTVATAGVVGCVGGCVSTTPKIEQLGEKNEANTATVLAKMDKVADRIVGVNKEVQTSVKSDIKATRDAVQKTGLGDWGLVAVVGFFVGGQCYCRRCEMRENIAEAGKS